MQKDTTKNTRVVLGEHSETHKDGIMEERLTPYIMNEVPHMTFISK